jgi:hypothetical protein
MIDLERRSRSLIKVLSQYMPEGTKETHGKPQDNQGRDLNTNQVTTRG